MHTGVLYNTTCGVVGKCKIAVGDVVVLAVIECYMYFPLFIVSAETADGLSIPYPRDHLEF